MKIFLALLHRDLQLAMRGNSFAAALGFFLLAASLAPLSFGSDAELLRHLAPALFWFLAVLAALLSLDGFFRPSLDTGDLEVLALSPTPLSMVALSRIISWWLVTGLPLCLCVFPAGVLFNLDLSQSLGLFFSLLFGTPGLFLLGGAISAIVAGLKHSSGLVVFLALPFFAPALIFGPAAATDLANGAFMAANPLLLLVFSLQALALSPFVCAASLHQHLD